MENRYFKIATSTGQILKNLTIQRTVKYFPYKSRRKYVTANEKKKIISKVKKKHKENNRPETKSFAMDLFLNYIYMPAYFSILKITVHLLQINVGSFSALYISISFSYTVNH